MMRDSNAITSFNGMTRDEKDLLLQDLCARLPYGVIISVKDINNFQFDGVLQVIGKNWCRLNILDPIKKAKVKNQTIPLNHIYIKPYLRPMSSMTEEEKFELKQEHVKDQQLFAEVIVVLNNTEMRGKVIPHFAADWCDKNMFDYRGLIDKGLAIEVTEENNPYKD